jgi:hypothetical protein
VEPAVPDQRDPGPDRRCRRRFTPRHEGVHLVPGEEAALAVGVAAAAEQAAADIGVDRGGFDAEAPGDVLGGDQVCIGGHVDMLSC